MQNIRTVEEVAIDECLDVWGIPSLRLLWTVSAEMQSEMVFLWFLGRKILGSELSSHLPTNNVLPFVGFISQTASDSPLIF